MTVKAGQLLDHVRRLTTSAALASLGEVWVSSEPIGEDRTKAKLVHTFQGETDNGQELKHTFATDQSARYVQIRTTQSQSWVGWDNIDLQVR